MLAQHTLVASEAAFEVGVVAEVVVASAIEALVAFDVKNYYLIVWAEVMAVDTVELAAAAVFGSESDEQMKASRVHSSSYRSDDAAIELMTMLQLASDTS